VLVVLNIGSKIRKPFLSYELLPVDTLKRKSYNVFTLPLLCQVFDVRFKVLADVKDLAASIFTVKCWYPVGTLHSATTQKSSTYNSFCFKICYTFIPTNCTNRRDKIMYDAHYKCVACDYS